MYSYVTRGLGFLVRCATISRQLGQGRQRSGGSPLFMINHRSSNNILGECRALWGERSEAWYRVTAAADAEAATYVKRVTYKPTA